MNLFCNYYSRLMSSRGAIIAVLVGMQLFIGALVFHAGASFGEGHALRHMAGRASGGMPPHEFGLFEHSFIPQGHGAVGVVAEVGTTTFTIRTREGATQIVYVGQDAIVRGRTQNESFASLVLGQYVVVVGEPDEDALNQLHARMIQIVSTQPTTTTN